MRWTDRECDNKTGTALCLPPRLGPDPSQRNDFTHSDRFICAGGNYATCENSRRLSLARDGEYLSLEFRHSLVVSLSYRFELLGFEEQMEGRPSLVLHPGPQTKGSVAKHPLSFGARSLLVTEKRLCCFANRFHSLSSATFLFSIITYWKTASMSRSSLAV